MILGMNWDTWPNTLEERLAWLRDNAGAMLADPSQHSAEELAWARTMADEDPVLAPLNGGRRSKLAIPTREAQSQDHPGVPDARGN